MFSNQNFPQESRSFCIFVLIKSNSTTKEGPFALKMHDFHTISFVGAKTIFFVSEAMKNRGHCFENRWNSWSSALYCSPAASLITLNLFAWGCIYRFSLLWGPYFITMNILHVCVCVCVSNKHLKVIREKKFVFAQYIPVVSSRFFIMLNSI